MREVIITPILYGFDQKNNFLRGGLDSSSIIWNWFRYGFEILHQSGKRLKPKIRKVLGANLYVCRSYRRKTGKGGGIFDPNPRPEID